MGSVGGTQKAATQVVLTRIPDSWAWIRPDLLMRLLPFTVAFAVAYVWSGGGRWPGLRVWEPVVSAGFAAVAGAPPLSGAALVQAFLLPAPRPLVVHARRVV